MTRAHRSSPEARADQIVQAFRAAELRQPPPLQAAYAATVSAQVALIGSKCVSRAPKETHHLAQPDTVAAAFKGHLLLGVLAVPDRELLGEFVRKAKRPQVGGLAVLGPQGPSAIVRRELQQHHKPQSARQAAIEEDVLICRSSRVDPEA